jgi:hypothetical protein
LFLPALILMTFVCTTLLSLPILAIMVLGSWIVEDVIPDAELAFYGGSLSALFCACWGRSLESRAHNALERFFERALGKWLK